MLFLKACPHCGGDLVTEHDDACGYLECVQCGHVLSRAQERMLQERMLQERMLGGRVSREGALGYQRRPRSPESRRSATMPGAGQPRRS